MKKMLILLASLLPLTAMAGTIPMHAVNQDGVGEKMGTVTVTESEYGLVLTPHIHGLTPGLHGFHVHQNPSCMPKMKQGSLVPALSAGSHYDPHNTGEHGTAWGKGHLGDLPPLFVDASGHAVQPVLAPRLKISDLKGRAFMIHAGGDNHSDHPKKLGGGGARAACGVIQ